MLHLLIENSYFKDSHLENRLATSDRNSVYDEDLQNESEDQNLIRCVLLLQRILEWLPQDDGFFTQYLWSPQEHIRRAIMYGKPKDEQDLERMLIPDRRGLWHHKMLTKEDILLQNPQEQHWAQSWIVQCSKCQKSEIKVFPKNQKIKGEDSNSKIMDNINLETPPKAYLDPEEGREIHIKSSEENGNTFGDHYRK